MVRELQYFAAPNGVFVRALQRAQRVTVTDEFGATNLAGAGQLPAVAMTKGRHVAGATTGEFQGKPLELLHFF